VSWPTLSKANGPLRVLGVDPGLRRLGYAVIEAAGDELLLLGAGLVLTPTGASQAERLAEIADGVESVVRDFEPHDAAMERVAFSHNVRKRAE
jgi:crossover junction endodeoxyribonuclease RuvC